MARDALTSFVADSANPPCDPYASVNRVVEASLRSIGGGLRSAR